VKLDNGTRLRAHYPATKHQRALERLIMANSGTGDSKNSGSSGWWTILTALLPFVLLFGFWIHLMSRTERRRSKETLISQGLPIRRREPVREPSTGEVRIKQGATLDEEVASL
jgi:ATP-dependent Zn protease